MKASGAIPSASNPFFISKSSQIRVLPGGTDAVVTWTVNITHNASANAGPLVVDRITDTLPQATATGPVDVRFGGTLSSSDVLPSNSTYVPTLGQTHVLTWLHVPPDQSYLVPSGNSGIRLVYTTLLTTYGRYTNTAYVLSGKTQLGPVTATAGYFAPTAVTLDSLDRARDRDLLWLPLALAAASMVMLGSLLKTLRC